MTQENISFSDKVAQELYDLTSSRSCCDKALLCGLLMGAKKAEGSKTYTSFFYRREDAALAARLIDARFFTGTPTEISDGARGGHKGYTVSFSSKALSAVLLNIDLENKKSAEEAIGFRCQSCLESFLRGVFLSTAALSRPKSGYHLELSFVTRQRADMVQALLTEHVAQAGRIERGSRYALYYKSNSKISDLLSFIGALQSSFDVTNTYIERDIRNNENRATNCVTRNISRSVDASRRHIDAINYLLRIDRLVSLGPELEYTAMLRLSNSDASLTELAMLHRPPISKSGLNGRLSRILAAADEWKLKREE